MVQRFYSSYNRVTQLAAQARARATQLSKKGAILDPIPAVSARMIAKSFWGNAWCDHLKQYSDYSNRMPRGRSYARHGAVIDLKISLMRVDANVSGSRVYTVKIDFDRLPADRWNALIERCTGGIDSLIDLLHGRLSPAVLGVFTDPTIGLFPKPDEIRLSCSCSDWAEMCKHVAAAMYGVGVRLDEQPALFFKLRGIDEVELVRRAAPQLRQIVNASVGDAGTSIHDSDLSSIFGIDVDLDQRDDTAQTGNTGRTKKKSATKTNKSVRKKKANKSADSKVRGRRTTAPHSEFRWGQRIQVATLLQYGMSRSTIHRWSLDGRLRKSTTRGIYLVTRRTRQAVDEFVSRRRATTHS